MYLDDSLEDVVFKYPAVLVVDDSDFNRELVTELLAHRNCNLFYAVNGRQAIEQVERERIDLILMDIQMPVMNGFEAIETLRAKHEARKIPIIAITASLPTMDEQEIREICGHYVRKPIDVTALVTEMMNLLPYTRQATGVHC